MLRSSWNPPCHQLFKKEALTLQLWWVISQSSVLPKENTFLKKRLRNLKAEGHLAWWLDVAESYCKLSALPWESSRATGMLYSLFAPQFLSLTLTAAQPSSLNERLQWNKQTNNRKGCEVLKYKNNWENRFISDWFLGPAFSGLLWDSLFQDPQPSFLWILPGTVSIVSSILIFAALHILFEMHQITVW